MSKEENLSLMIVKQISRTWVPIIILTNFTDALDDKSIPDLYTALTTSNHLVIVASDHIIKDIKINKN